MAQVAETPHLGNSIFVVGIDIGSTYSGYAFASKEDFQCVPPKFHTNVFCGSRLLSLKAPTAVLFDSNKQLKAFGFDAENQFSEILIEEEQDEYYYFHQFPSMLHNQTVTRATEINDATGKSMPAITVFSAVIEYLKTQVIKKINFDILKNTRLLEDDDCFFVLTVPAIWDHCTKTFMGEAAALAGIKKKKLAIIPEQKAASIYCQSLKTHREEEVRHSVSEIIQEGMPYMVIDLGGTTKITVLQRQPDGGISTVGVPPCVIPVGGKSIDEPFVDLLSNICGPDAVRELKETELDDYIDLLREFETKKRSIKTDQCNKIVITLPVSLTDLVKKKYTKFENALEKSRYKDEVAYAKQKLHISPETFRGLFKNTIKEIIKLIGKLFKDPKLSVANTILMVGGFAECELIQDAVRQAIGITRTLIIPEDAGLVVLKGAVLFGHQPKPKVVSQRIARYTYGIQSCWPNMEPERYTENENLERGNDVFYKFITKGEQLQSGHEVSRIFKALKSGEETVKCSVYQSTNENPRYITDPSCERIGTLVIQLLPNTVEVIITLIFGDGEIKCRSRARTERTFEALFNLP